MVRAIHRFTFVSNRTLLLSLFSQKQLNVRTGRFKYFVIICILVSCYSLDFDSINLCFLIFPIKRLLSSLSWILVYSCQIYIFRVWKSFHKVYAPPQGYYQVYFRILIFHSNLLHCTIDGSFFHRKD